MQSLELRAMVPAVLPGTAPDHTNLGTFAVTDRDDNDQPQVDTDDEHAADDSETVYKDDVERQWGEASSIRGLDPSLLSKKRRRRHHRAHPPVESAAFSPWLIPLAAILTGPVMAALLTIFADGEPPTIRQMVSVVALGCTAWAINLGLASEELEIFSAPAAASARLGVLTVCGAALWAMYVYWFNGNTQLDRQGLIHSAILVFAMSLLFWLGRDTAWWAWLGR